MKLAPPTTVSIRKASAADAAVIAAMHLEEMPEAFLTSMGPGFVAAFYRTLLDSPWGFAFVAERGREPVGYVTGVVHWRRFYRMFVLRNPGLAVRALLRKALEIRGLRRLAETTRYTATAVLPDAEFLSMVVRPKARGAGVAQAMVRELLDEFARRGVDRVRTTTAGSNVASARVFERCGFRFIQRIELHPGEDDLLYEAVLKQTGAG